jgi:hypothetical protein
MSASLIGSLSFRTHHGLRCRCRLRARHPVGGKGINRQTGCWRTLHQLRRKRHPSPAGWAGNHVCFLAFPIGGHPRFGAYAWEHTVQGTCSLSSKMSDAVDFERRRKAHAQGDDLGAKRALGQGRERKFGTHWRRGSRHPRSERRGRPTSTADPIITGNDLRPWALPLIAHPQRDLSGLRLARAP